MADGIEMGGRDHAAALADALRDLMADDTRDALYRAVRALQAYDDWRRSIRLKARTHSAA